MSAILIIDDEDKYLELCRRFMPEHEFIGPARNYAHAAQLLGVEVADVLAELEAGNLKGRKIGSAWRIAQAALDEFLAG